MDSLLQKYTDNQKRLLTTIRDSIKLTRAELVRLSGFSPLTVARSVAAFCADGIVSEYGTEASTGGRKPAVLGISPHFGYVVSADIGASSVKLGIVNMVGEILESERITPPRTGIPAPVLSPAELSAKIRLLLDKYGRERCLGVGIGISGIVDADRRKVVFCPNIRGWDDFALTAFFEQELELPVHLDTSARCMALAERRFGAGAGVDNLLLVSIGYSIAAGIIVDGKLFRGGSGSAGEFGHIQVSSADDWCTCGNRGCLELYVTLPMIIAKIKRILRNTPGHSLMNRVTDNIDRLDTDSVARALEIGDSMVFQAFSEAGQTIGLELANIANIINPDKIILAGGLIERFPLVFEEAARQVRERSLVTVRSHLTIARSKLGADCAVIGCATQVLNSFFE